MMAPRLVLAAALILLGGGAADAVAAPESPPAAGTRVRVTLLERVPAESLADPSHIGRLLTLDADSLVLEPQNASGTRLALHRPAIATLEVSQGRRSRAGRGALIGLLAGAVGGTALGLHTLGSRREAQGFEPIVFGIVGAFGGLGLGALVGSSIHVEDWHSVTPNTPAPASGR